MGVNPTNKALINALARSRAARAIKLPCAVVPRMAGVRPWTPTEGRIITGKMRLLSHVLPMHLSAADAFPHVKVVNLPVSVAGINHKLPVLFGSNHDQRPYGDRMQVMSGGKFWQFPVYWPVMDETFEIPWKNGLHQIPSQGLIALASRFDASFSVRNAQTGRSHDIVSHDLVITPSGIKGRITDDINGLVGLYIPFGALAVVQTKGPDAGIAMQAVNRFFNGFTEMDWYRGRI